MKTLRIVFIMLFLGLNAYALSYPSIHQQPNSTGVKGFVSQALEATENLYSRRTIEYNPYLSEHSFEDENGDYCVNAWESFKFFVPPGAAAVSITIGSTYNTNYMVHYRVVSGDIDHTKTFLKIEDNLFSGKTVYQEITNGGGLKFTETMINNYLPNGGWVYVDVVGDTYWRPSSYVNGNVKLSIIYSLMFKQATTFMKWLEKDSTLFQSNGDPVETVASINVRNNHCNNGIMNIPVTLATSGEPYSGDMVYIPTSSSSSSEPVVTYSSSSKSSSSAASVGTEQEQCDAIGGTWSYEINQCITSNPPSSSSSSKSYSSYTYSSSSSSQKSTSDEQAQCALDGGTWSYEINQCLIKTTSSSSVKTYSSASSSLPYCDEIDYVSSSSSSVSTGGDSILPRTTVQCIERPTETDEQATCEAGGGTWSYEINQCLGDVTTSSSSSSEQKADEADEPDFGEDAEAEVRRAAAEIVSEQTFEINGYFAHYGDGAYDWVYVNSAGTLAAKLEGMKADGNLDWEILHYNTVMHIETIGFNEDRTKLIFGAASELPGTPSVTADIAGQEIDINGFFVHYADGAYDWVYMSKSGGVIAKLDGLDEATDNLIWVILNDGTIQTLEEGTEAIDNNTHIIFGRSAQ